MRPSPGQPHTNPRQRETEKRIYAPQLVFQMEGVPCAPYKILRTEKQLHAPSLSIIISANTVFFAQLW